MLLAMISAAIPAAPALADSGRPPMTARHQMIAKTIGCMRKQMSVDKAVTYNEAAKICADQIRKQSEQSAPAALAASGRSTKP
jgi:hypothetical protein